MDLLPKWSPKNPLEVIAIFIALIYGICALLLGAAVGTLEKYNQTAMVWFIILFPVAVLAVFGWLVRNHHTKLYAPGDYRSDDAFHGAQAASESLAPRLEEEIVEPPAGLADPPEHEAAPVEVPPEVRQAPEPDAAVEAQPESGTSSQRSSTALNAYLVEGLAFQELQKEFNASVRRHLSLPTTYGASKIVDGALETAAGMAIVEVRTLSSHADTARRIRESFSNLSGFDRSAISRNARLIAVFIVADELQRLKISTQIYNIQLKQYSDIEVRVFVYANLLHKYGFE